ncbi:MAG: RtcB family protein [Clostridia bacterium]|nr:RtcB family protein [Clostridia bacterium]
MRDLKIFTDKIGANALNQINELLEQEAFKDCKVRIMPDVHAGVGCVIGFTADLKDKVVPNLVGVDIGCGVMVAPLGNIEIDFSKLDNFIKNEISYGLSVNKKVIEPFDLTRLRCYKQLDNIERLEKALGSLGGGNHFIEIDKSNDGSMFLVVHTGSRNLGLQVANLYQKLAIKLRKEAPNEEREAVVNKLKSEGRQDLIPSALDEINFKYRNETKLAPKLCYLDGKEREDYLHDMRICQEWAKLNRKTLIKLITNYLQKEQGIRYAKNIDTEIFDVAHNYIADDNIIRKGAISARDGEKVIIPLNMRDGCIIGIGKGNEDWNYSAPHGAGRLFSRGDAKHLFSLQEYKDAMQGIFTTTVNMSTLDESPFAYKEQSDIVNNIGETVEIIDIIKPIYNFKASE